MRCIVGNVTLLQVLTWRKSVWNKNDDICVSAATTSIPLLNKVSVMSLTVWWIHQVVTLPLNTCDDQHGDRIPVRHTRKQQLFCFDGGRDDVFTPCRTFQLRLYLLQKAAASLRIRWSLHVWGFILFAFCRQIFILIAASSPTVDFSEDKERRFSASSDLRNEACWISSCSV